MGLFPVRREVIASPTFKVTFSFFFADKNYCIVPEIQLIAVCSINEYNLIKMHKNRFFSWKIPCFVFYGSPEQQFYDCELYEVMDILKIFSMAGRIENLQQVTQKQEVWLALTKELEKMYYPFV